MRTDCWHLPAGQERAVSLSTTLAAARIAGKRAGVTRLADVTGLTPFGIPLFQAVRPLALSVSVSQGKGLTPMAAMVSALLEASELAVAERLPQPVRHAALADLGPDVLAAWSTAPREPYAQRLDPLLQRQWLTGQCLISGNSFPVPRDLIALDFTQPSAADVRSSSSGLASGNTRTEAAVGAIGELLERDLTALFDALPAKEKRSSEVALSSVDDPLAQEVIARIERQHFDVRLWAMGQAFGIAAMRCAIAARGSHIALPPAIGSGCHPNRTIATLRALLEAVQVHGTLVAGARDDLRPEHYDDADGQRFSMILESLSFDRGTLNWSRVPDQGTASPEAALAVLLGVAETRSPLPVIGLEHPSGVPGIAVFRAIAPGLCDPARVAPVPAVQIPSGPALAIRQRRPPVVFVGPTLGSLDLSPHVEHRPPAQCGDLADLLRDPPAAVGLIDGAFETAPTVWHKEILDLSAHGVAVLGAASLGAIRAAELHRHGMIGVGRIFAAYRDGLVNRDDAVMLVHAPAELGWKPLTVTLVDAEDALSSIRMEPGERRMLQRIVRTTPYTRRTWAGCVDTFVGRVGRYPRLDVAMLEAHPSLKRADALELMTRLQTIDHRHAPFLVPKPPMTAPYVQMLATLRPTRR